MNRIFAFLRLRRILVSAGLLMLQAGCGTVDKHFSACCDDMPAPGAGTPELLLNNYFSQGTGYWTVTDTTIVSSGVRAGGQAMNVGGTATQYISSGALTPGKAYRLKVKARKLSDTGSATMSLNIRSPKSYQAVRTHRIVISSTSYVEQEISFTAPPYAGISDLVVQASGTRVIVDTVSMTEREAIVQTEPIESNAHSYAPENYTLVFNDEFNGVALNNRKWWTRMIYSGGTQDRLNDEQQRYRDSQNHLVANGVLSLIARKVTSGAANGIDYESGMIRSDWTTRYGYFEARVKMPSAVGVWPAFWLNSDVSEKGVLTWPPEIDIFEMVNNGVEDTLDMLHSAVSIQSGMTSSLTYVDPAFNTTWTFWRAPFRFDADWHTIGAEWTPEQVTVYVDGQKIYTRYYKWVYNDLTLAGPAHIILNLAVGGSWAGRHGIDASAFPQALQIDWVRAYRAPQ